MAYSPIEDKYLSALTAMQFPDEPPMPEPTAPAQAAPAGQQPGDVLVAEAGSRNLPEQAYSGRYPDSMKAIEPTVRERLASILQSSFEGLGMDRYKARQNAQTLIGGGSSNLPLNIGLADFVPFLGTGLQTEEAAIMGGESIESAKRGELGTAALQAGGAVVGLVPGVAGTVKAGKALAPTAGKMALETMEKLGTPVQMNIVPPSPTTASAATKAMAPASDIGFYSAVEKAALNVQRNSGSGQSFLNDITKGENVKLDEIKWMGLDDFLKGKKNVTKQEVQDFVQNNRVDVQEVALGGEFKPITNPEEAIIYLANEKGVTPNQLINEYGYKDKNDYVTLANDVAQPVEPKFGKFTLPGGENYREILLTLPTKNVGANEVMIDKINTRLVDKGFDGLAEEQRIVMASGGNDAINMLIDLQDRVGIKTDDIQKSMAGGDPSKQYRSSHFDEPNVLAHIRVNDRVDADGKKMLLIEEVQSDWHQAGREKGYQGNYNKNDIQPYSIDQAKAEFGPDNSDLFWYFKVPDNVLQIPKSRFATQDEAFNYVLKEKKTNVGGVPDAPFKDTWYQLALKRALRYAADNGYDRVGLTTGKQQAERYDLSKQVDDLNVFRDEDGTFSIKATLMSDQSVKDVGKQIKPEQLSEYVGKDLAEQILQQKSGTKKVYSGDDLKVGGEGMKKYYDDVYPKFLQKYGKKWGASVGETQIKTGRGVPGGEPVRYIDITPEMRKSVQKGQPLAAVSGEETVA